MKTTIRIRDRLFREAKALAALEGVTLTSFIEEGLRLRLKLEREHKPVPYRLVRLTRKVSAPR